MREQTRIYKNISEYKQSKRKDSTGQPDDGLNKAYVSSRIIKKIAEDHINQSIKHIISAAEEGKIDLG